jgi:hypothetical protein
LHTKQGGIKSFFPCLIVDNSGPEKHSFLGFFVDNLLTGFSGFKRFKVQGSKFQVSGYRVQEVQEFKSSRVQSSKFKVSGFKFQVFERFLKTFLKYLKFTLKNFVLLQML